MGRGMDQRKRWDGIPRKGLTERRRRRRNGCPPPPPRTIAENTSPPLAHNGLPSDLDTTINPHPMGQGRAPQRGPWRTRLPCPPPGAPSPWPVCAVEASPRFPGIPCGGRQGSDRNPSGRGPGLDGRHLAGAAVLGEQLGEGGGGAPVRRHVLQGHTPHAVRGVQGAAGGEGEGASHTLRNPEDIFSHMSFWL